MSRSESALLTDLYQLTMLQGYHRRSMNQPAVFEFFVRRLPAGRNFLLAGGLEQALDYLEGLSFPPEELEWLHHSGRFTPDFVDSLATLRFTGDVDAMPEGTVFFPDEPVLRVTAPLPEAQIVESRLINILHFQTLIATKAARCVLAAPGKLLVDFGMRRAHGAEAALMAARASFLAGFSGTATVLAERRFGIPTYGTMAHSFIQAHDDELGAFRDFAHAQPDNVVLLIDTYDTLEGARRVVKLAPELEREGIAIKAVRLDSGDLAAEARAVRAILDAGGCESVSIFCSGSLDEYALEQLLAAEAPAEGFGIGTNLDVSADAPALDCVYKLQEYAGRARRKRSSGKATWPGRKQVFRRHDAAGAMTGDTLTIVEDAQEGEALLQPVMRAGTRLEPSPALTAIRERVAGQLLSLPPPLRQLQSAAPYPVEIAPRLAELAATVDRAFH